VLFAVAFGYLEAAIVDYLNVVYEPARKRIHPAQAPEDVFPLLTLDELRAVAPQQVRLLGVEVVRELATLVMLAAVALSVARNAGQWAAAFAIVFGVWDVFFYVFLELLMDWPPSLLTWDLLFLIPVPWAAPVLAPLLVSASMITAGSFHLWREAVGRPVRIRTPHWLGVFAGAAVIVMSFTLHYRHLLAGGLPRRFNWMLFALGEAVGILSYGGAVRTSKQL
jgi:hypothetical protein